MRRVEAGSECLAAWVRFRKKRERRAAAVPVVRSMRSRGSDDDDKVDDDDEDEGWCDADEEAVLICGFVLGVIGVVLSVSVWLCDGGWWCDGTCMVW